MKKKGEIFIAIFCLFSFISVAVWPACYYFGGLSHLYHSQDVINQLICFCVIAIIALGAIIAIIVMMFKSKKTIKIISKTILIVFIPIALFSSFVSMLIVSILGQNGCSYTEDISNYAKFDKGIELPNYFPDVITDDMTVVKYVYFYKYIDVQQIDIYLEVKFENEETMTTYLTTAQNAFSEKGVITYQNPYHSKYTDIIENSSKNAYPYVSFADGEVCGYVLMNYDAVSFSYDDLTIIYNYTDIGSDVGIGNDPDNGFYYPKFLERFEVVSGKESDFELEDIGLESN